MSLDESAIKAIENGSPEHEPERFCMQCGEMAEHVEFQLVEFVGGQHWVCEGCKPEDE